jgi:hypothetical protein
MQTDKVDIGHHGSEDEAAQPIRGAGTVAAADSHAGQQLGLRV